MEIHAVGVIGLGTMGAGIAEVLARGGFPVTAVEVDPQALAKGVATLNASLDRAVSRGKLTPGQRAEIAGRVTPAAKLADLAAADLVIEVVPEQLAIKRAVIGELEACCRPDAIIATNTSSLSVTAIAAACTHPERVVGLHFFNPAPVMGLVEVVTTVLTGPAVGAAVSALARRLGKTPVQVTDRAGFVANALLLPYLNHAARMLETGYARREDIDLAMTKGAGLPMGPLALLDLIGLDTSLAILEVLRREFGGPRYTPTPLLRRLTEAGRLGRKTGAGFYEYREPAAATADSPVFDPANGTAAPGTVTLIDPAAGPTASARGDDPPDPPVSDQRVDELASAARAADLASLLAAAGINVTRNPAHPTDLVIVAIDAAGDVLRGSVQAAGRAAETVGLHLVNSGLVSTGLAELVPSPLTSAQAVRAAREVVAKLGRTAVLVPDRPGLLVSGLLYPHLRDAAAMVADGYATPADIDAAMTLGCGYPRGPIELLAEVGLEQVVEVLDAMHAGYGDPAFAPPPMLRQHALAGLTLTGEAAGPEAAGPEAAGPEAAGPEYRP
jgi:3-hydroxybutyryl-CoA dehydrogenase